MSKIIAGFAVTAALSFSAMAADVSGFIIDKSCAEKPAMRGNVSCAQTCLKRGDAAVLVTDAGKVYQIDDQTKVVEHAGKKVTITGKIDGDTIKVESVKL
jgi:hypothetical protein